MGDDLPHSLSRYSPYIPAVPSQQAFKTPRIRQANKPPSSLLRQAKLRPRNALIKRQAHKPLISLKSALNQAYKRPLIIFKYFF